MLASALRPQAPPDSYSTAEGSRGHIAGHLQGKKPKVSAEPLCPSSSPLRAGGSRWTPEEGRDGIRPAGGSFGTQREWDRRPASCRGTREPGDPAIDSNREAAVYSNTAPPGPSPGDAARPGAPSSWRGRPPSWLPGASAALAGLRPLPPPDIIRQVRGLSAARARLCANLHS